MANDENLRPFSTEYQPANRGRKPSKLKALVKEMDLSKSDVAAIFLDLIGEKTEAELQDILRDKSQPWMIRGFIRALVEDFKTGRTGTIREMLEWTFGKTIQKVALTGIVSTPGQVSMTEEEEAVFKANLGTIIPGIFQIVEEKPDPKEGRDE